MKIAESQTNSEERDIIAASQRGDRAAFKSLYDRYRDRVYNLIFYSMGDELGAQHIPLEALLGGDEEVDSGAAADLQHAEGERREIIHRAVMELSPKLRAVVALKYLDGLSYEEIASVLECSPGTVASRLNRALSELEARLRPLRRLL